MCITNFLIKFLLTPQKKKIMTQILVWLKCVRFYDDAFIITVVIVSKTNQIKNIMPNARRSEYV